MGSDPVPVRHDPGAVDLIDFRTTGVLRALILLHERDGRATVRDISRATGLTLSATYHRLRKLRRLGLVDWTDNRSATLRPLVRRVA